MSDKKTLKAKCNELLEMEISNKMAWGILLLSFLVACVIRYLMSDFPKMAQIYPDELRYWDIPRGLYAGNGITLQGIPYNHQKIGYCLLYVPFFAIKDVVLRIKLISLMNVILLCSSSIWIFLLAKEWKMKNLHALLLGILCLLWPNQLYSMTFMSESFYVPVFLVGLWLFVHNEERQKPWIACLCGAFCYLNYFIKERGIVLPMALAGIEIGFPIFQFLFCRKKSQKRPEYDKKHMLNCLLMLVVFFGIFFIVKKATFHNAPNEWWSMDVQSMVVPNRLSYGIYCILYYLVVVTIAVLALPIFVPAVLYGRMKERDQKHYLLLMMMNVLMSGMVSLRIAMYEDYGKLQPRMHLRYFGPQIFLTLVFFFVVLYHYRHELADKVIQKRYLFWGCVCFAVVILVFKGMYRGSSVDHYDLHWTISNPSYEYPIRLRYVIQAIYSVAVMLGIVVFGGYASITKNKMLTGVSSLVGILLVLCGINNVSGAGEIKGEYGVDLQEVKELVEISSFIDTHPDDTYMVISYFQDLKAFNTYCDQTPSLYLENEDYFWDSVDRTQPIFENEINKIEFYRFPWQKLAEGPCEVDYFIVGEAGNSAGFWRFDNVEEVFEGEYYHMYRNLYPNKITLSNPYFH